MQEFINILVPLIQNVGFPIACVIGRFYFWNKERLDHKEELKAVTEALNNNTLALQRLSDKISSCRIRRSRPLPWPRQSG